MRRRLKLLPWVACIGLFACATYSAIYEQHVTAYVTSVSRPGGRDPARIRFYCHGEQVAIANNLSLSVITRVRVRFNQTCPYLRWRVEVQGSNDRQAQIDPWRLDQRFNPEDYTSDPFGPVEEGDSVTVILTADLAGSMTMVYHRE